VKGDVAMSETELPAEAVEAAARALYLADRRAAPYPVASWDEAPAWERKGYRDDVRAALAAAAPSLREAWETELRESGALVLPPNPFGTSATWADFDWNGIAQNVRSAAARAALERIADAVRGVSDV
jgi:hypothetical protein